MTKRGPHGTLRQVSPLAANDAAPSGDAAPSDAAVPPDVTEKPREDEYADQVVQQFRSTRSKTLTAEKKIVIPSREAKTVKVRHEDVPQLAAALERERARAAGKAARAAGLPVREHPDDAPAAPALPAGESAESGAGWIEDPDSFDAEVFASEHPPPLASAREASTPAKSRAGWLLLLLAGVSIAGGVAIYLAGPPSWMSAPGAAAVDATKPPSEPSAGDTANATPSVSPDPAASAETAASSAASAETAASSAAAASAATAAVSSNLAASSSATASASTKTAPPTRRRAPAPNTEIYPDF